jgi:hypothetical protein
MNMAEILDDFDFNKGKYPWKEWEDGKIRKAVKGVDFQTTPSTFQSTLGQRARSNGMRVQTERVGEDGVVFQFYLKSEPQENP